MEENSQEKVEIEIREYSDADFYPESCPSCGHPEVIRNTYKIRTLQGLGSPTICRRARYEKVTFECKKCETTFSIEHPLVPYRSTFMPGVLKYATERVLKKGDSIRRVTRDLNEFHKVEVSVGTVKQWVDKAGNRGELKEDLSDEDPPEEFSGFIALDGTFKSATTKKNSRNGTNTEGKSGN